MTVLRSRRTAAAGSAGGGPLDTDLRQRAGVLAGAEHALLATRAR